MPIAYSYMRFSSEKQAKGDSFRRQEELVKDYLESHPEIELDTSLSLRDAGTSAYKGLHAKKGALGVFIRLVDDGKIEKGSYLLVEHFDRLSREEILKAQTQFLQLINEDIDRSYMSQIERCLANPSIDAILRISNALEVAPSELLLLTKKKS